MDFNRPLFPPNAFRFKSGGGTDPKAGPIQAPPAPSAAPASVEVTQAKLDAKRNAKAKTGINSTILAGNEAFAPAQQAGGKNTILGGG
jgi:hypothetical protein